MACIFIRTQNFYCFLNKRKVKKVTVGVGGVAQAVRVLASKHGALSLNSSAARKIKEDNSSICHVF
jgi:hypothetical protein